jgi:hypothetical protein
VTHRVDESSLCESIRIQEEGMIKIWLSYLHLKVPKEINPLMLLECTMKSWYR